MWKYSGAAGWSFVTLPEELSKHIKTLEDLVKFNLEMV
jgi:hypothetical protein